ncbi:hypothetical protein HDU96_005245 [Phlyctochytrium bullatum]|nr:hypothetical protein HDU96_005245 [Phlyctochytrium bullatum]
MASFEVEVASVGDLKDGEMKEISLGDGRGKVLLSKIKGEFFATSHLCPHYKAPLIKGVLSQDGRVMCPWHGACFRVQSGDIEDGPSVDALHSFTTKIKGDKVFVTVNGDDLKAGRKVPVCVKKSSSNTQVAIVLGGGAGGLVASEALRQEGFTGRVILISREPYLPIDRPKLSKALKIDPSKIQLRDSDFYAKNEIEVHLSTFATAVDPSKKSVTLNNGKVLNYTYLVVATGGDPRKLPVPGSDLANIFTLRGADDSNGIEKAVSESGEKPNVVVVGSSFIGMEAAAILAKTCTVTVIGMEKVPFERVLGPVVGEALGKLNTANGVTLKMQAMLDRFEASAKDSSKIGFVVLKTGERIPADVVIIGAGVIPKTDFLKNTSVVIDRDQGITVDKYLRVPNAEGVFAIGDIARYPYHLTGESVRVEHWNVAQNQGRVAAHNIARLVSGLDVDRPFVQVPYFWTVQYGKSIRYAGHAESFDDIVIQGTVEGDNLSFAAFYGRGGKVLAVASVAKDPVVSHASELIRVGKMPSIDELKAGKDVLTVPLTGEDNYVYIKKKSSPLLGNEVNYIVAMGVLMAFAAVAISMEMRRRGSAAVVDPGKVSSPEASDKPEPNRKDGDKDAAGKSDAPQAAQNTPTETGPPSDETNERTPFWKPKLQVVTVRQDTPISVAFRADNVCECFRQQTDEFGFPVTDAAILTKLYLFKRLGIFSLIGSIPFDIIALVVYPSGVCNDHSYLFPNAYEAWAYLRVLRVLPSWKAVAFFVNIDVKGLSTPLQRLIKTMAFILGVIHLDLRTDLERAYSIIETLLAAMIFGGLLGLIMALIKSTVKTVASKQAIEDGMIEENIKRFMVSKSFPPRLQDEVMKHIRYKANMMKGMELGKAFGELPDTLTEDIYLCLYSDLINSISLFKNTDISFRMSVIRSLTPLTLPANTTIFSEGEEALDL